MKKIRPKGLKASESKTESGAVKVRIADLKAHLSEHLRAVRAGASLTILDRETPIATVVPIQRNEDRPRIRPATVKWGRISFPKLGPMLIDPVEVLLEMRRDKY